MPRILCARFPHLALIAAQLQAPELRGEPVIVGGAPQLRLPVIAASAVAQEAGVRCGQPLRQAQQLCPSAAFVSLDAMGVDRLREAVLTALIRLSPAVEAGDEEVYCDLSGRHAALGSEAAWAAAVARSLVTVLDGEVPAVGVAGSRLVAQLAARLSEPRRVRRVLEGEEAAFLAPLPVSVLGLDPRVTARLAALGMDRLGEVAALSTADLQRQFGRDGATISRLARGEEGGGLTPVRPPRTQLERVVLDGAVADLEVLRFSLHRCAEALGDRLREAGLTAGSVALTLELDGGGESEAGVEPPVPAGSATELGPVILGLLDGMAVAAPVVAVRLELGSLDAGVGRQVDMWRRGDGSRDAIAHTVARLRSRFGDESVRQARLTLDPGDIPERRFIWGEPGAVMVRR